MSKDLTPEDVETMYASEVLWPWDKLVMLRHAFVLDQRTARADGNGRSVNFCHDRIVAIDRELLRRTARTEGR